MCLLVSFFLNHQKFELFLVITRKLDFIYLFQHLCCKRCVWLRQHQLACFVFRFMFEVLQLLGKLNSRGAWTSQLVIYYYFFYIHISPFSPLSFFQFCLLVKRSCCCCRRWNERNYEALVHEVKKGGREEKEQRVVDTHPKRGRGKRRRRRREKKEEEEKRRGGGQRTTTTYWNRRRRKTRRKKKERRRGERNMVMNLLLQLFTIMCSHQATTFTCKQSSNGHHCRTLVQLKCRLGLLVQLNVGRSLGSGEARTNKARAIQYGLAPSQF